MQKFKVKKLKTETVQNLKYGILMLGLAIFSASCGKVEEAVTGTTNDFKVQGRWLMVGPEHASALTTWAENESVVLSFKNGQAVLSPTGAKGLAVGAFNKWCLDNPRPFKIDNNQIVLLAKDACAEKRFTIQQLDGTNLKFPDPDNTDVTQVFTKIDENRYKALVAPKDQKI